MGVQIYIVRRLEVKQSEANAKKYWLGVTTVQMTPTLFTDMFFFFIMWIRKYTHMMALFIKIDIFEN